MTSPSDATPAGAREPAPEPPFRLKIDMNADTWPDMIRRLARLVEHIEEHGPECNEVSGGGGGSHYVTITRRDVPVEQYHDELTAWLVRQREETAADMARRQLRRPLAARPRDEPVTGTVPGGSMESVRKGPPVSAATADKEET